MVAAPIPVPATDGKTHLAYELALTNTLSQDATLTSVTVRAGDRTLLTLPGDRIGAWTRLSGTPSPTTVLGPAQSGVRVAGRRPARRRNPFPSGSRTRSESRCANPSRR